MTLPELRALLEMAWPEEWEADKTGMVVYVKGDQSRRIGDIRGWGWLQYQENGAAIQDAHLDLVVALRNEAPALLDRLERLERALEQVGCVALAATNCKDRPDDAPCVVCAALEEK